MCGFTTRIIDSKNHYIFFANNHSFAFLDRTTEPFKSIKVYFKHVLWMELIKKDQLELKFDTLKI